MAEHGSWNRSNFSGYKLVFVPFKNGKPSGDPQDFLTGFIANEEKSEVYGRPVGIAVLETVFDVPLKVGAAPKPGTPFVLPQSVRLAKTVRVA